jgi:hypothetical protein
VLDGEGAGAEPGRGEERVLVMRLPHLGRKALVRACTRASVGMSS